MAPRAVLLVVLATLSLQARAEGTCPTLPLNYPAGTTLSPVRA
jgi:hypothetical protein